MEECTDLYLDSPHFVQSGLCVHEKGSSTEGGKDNGEEGSSMELSKLSS